MAELPPLLSGAVTKPLTTTIGASDIQQPYSLLAEGLKKTGEAADTFATSMAERAGLEAGTKAVTTDENGNTRVESTSPLIPFIGPAAKHYQDAVKFAALAEGEGAARRQDIALRQQFRDNPEGYNKAATEYMDGLQKQYTQAAGPLVGIALRKALELTTTQTYKGLLSEKERLDLYRQSSAIEAGREDAANRLQALANGGVTEGKDWDYWRDKYNTLGQQKEDNPRLATSHEEIVQQRERLTSQLNAAAIGYHAVRIYKDPENGGYDKAIEFANEIRTNPAYNLRPAERETLYNHAVQQINAAARGDERVVKGVGSDIAGVNDLSLKGRPVSDDQMAHLRAEVEATKNPQLLQMMHEAEGLARWAKDARRMTPEQLEQSKANTEAEIRERGSTPVLEKLVEAHDKLDKEMRTALTKDPLGWSNQVDSAMPVPPIDPSNPATLANRKAVAEQIAEKYHIPPSYFRPDEKKALADVATKGGPAMEQLAKVMSDGFREAAPAAMKELSHSAPTLAFIGAHQMSGGDPGFTSDVVEGVRMRGDKEFMKELPPSLNRTSETIYDAQNAFRQKTYGGAFVFQPEQGQAAQEAAGNAFFARAFRNHYDIALGVHRGATVPIGVQPQAPSEKAYEQTLQQAAGAHFVGGVQYGGVADYRTGGFWNAREGKVIVPPSVKAPQFGTVLRAITDADLSTMAIPPMKADGTMYRASDLHNATPIKVKGGYAFAQGDPQSADPKLIRGALGSAFVLDFDQMEPKLRQRVPSAFMSGR